MKISILFIAFVQYTSFVLRRKVCVNIMCSVVFGMAKTGVLGLACRHFSM